MKISRIFNIIFGALGGAYWLGMIFCKIFVTIYEAFNGPTFYGMGGFSLIFIFPIFMLLGGIIGGIIGYFIKKHTLDLLPLFVLLILPTLLVALFYLGMSNLLENPAIALFIRFMQFYRL